MYIYTETATALDRPHPSRARPGVTYARTRALLSGLVLIGSVVIGRAVVAAMRMSAVFILQ